MTSATAANASPASRAAPTKVPFTEPVPLTKPPLLIALTLATMLLSVGFYAVLSAQLTTQVSASGVMLSGGSALPVVSPSDGQVAGILVADGAQVSTEQVVGAVFEGTAKATPLVSPLSGEVLHTVVRRGEVIAAGDPLLYLFDPAEPLVVTAFVPADQALHVRPGQTVRVVPLDGTSNSPAYVAGTVAHIEPVPASAARMAQAFVAPDPSAAPSAASTAPASPMREVVISFTGDLTSIDQLQWEGTAPSSSPFGQGATVTVEIITGEESVLSLLSSRP